MSSAEPLSPLPADIVIRTPLATPPSSPSPLSMILISLDRERASRTIKTQKTGLISCDRVPIDQERGDCSSSNMIIQMPFDHQGTAVAVSMAEHAEVIWNLCITGLPIEKLVAYTVGMYTFYISPHLIFTVFFLAWTLFKALLIQCTRQLCVASSSHTCCLRS